MKRIIIISIALLLLAGGLLAQKALPPKTMQQNPNLKARPVPDDPMLNLAEELKLTEAQIRKFDELRMGFDKNENSTTAEIENLQIDKEAAMKAENFTKAKELNKQIYAKKMALADARVDFMSARLKELNPEQKEIMMKKMMMFEGFRNNMRGKHQGPMMQGKNMMQRKHMMQDNCSDCANCTDDGANDGKATPKNGKMKMK